MGGGPRGGEVKIHQCSLDFSAGSRWPCASQAYSMTRGERKLLIESLSRRGFCRVPMIVNVHQLFREAGQKCKNSTLVLRWCGIEYL